MKSTNVYKLLLAAAVTQVSAHATWQDLWVDGVDQGASCVRLPPSNNPVQNVQSTDIRCNVNGSKGVSGKCTVAAGGKVTVEMHQQPGDRSCSSEAIGGAHYGPVTAYMSKVADASTADGSAGWFKVYQDGWGKNPSGASGDDDYWGTKDLNTNCGKMTFTIPSTLASGDYLLRPEALALHTASSSGQAQFYMSCFQLTVTGGGSYSPATVNFPGAYSASDQGILVNIHAPMSSYAVPGPSVCTGGQAQTPPGGGNGGGSLTATKASTSAAATTTRATTTTTAAGGGTTSRTTTTAGGGTNCSAKYGQCGGTGWTGPTCCQSGSTCQTTNQYYSQCL